MSVRKRVKESSSISLASHGSRKASITGAARLSRISTGNVDIPRDESTIDSEIDPLVDNVGAKDLASLSELSEESILAELGRRYSHEFIYTYVGDILIAVNPFHIVPGLYSEEASVKYMHTSEPCENPHVYAVAQRAYQTLLDEHKDQCCVISGESGAGKTETAKYIVEHLLSMCKGTGQLEQKIIEVNPLLEAFGNAKTLFNDNSSRFGKYLEIKFGYFGDVLGAQLAEYLLETSRIVRQGDGERNFHVFYYIFGGAPKAVKDRFGFTDLTDFHYLRGGHKGLTRDAAIDLDADHLTVCYNTLERVLHDVGFTHEESESLHGVIACVLHLGNIEFYEAESSFADVSPESPIRTVSHLLGMEVDDVRKMLVSTVHMTRGEELRKNFNVEKAEDNRDAFAKAMYGRLFGWIVSKVNALLRPRGAAYQRSKEVDGGVTEVGILDIFGFENFEENSFEQFCINIANEQLQYYFNQHIFAWEQSVYEEEGLPLHTIAYSDNSDLLDMILGKPLGMLSILDEESRFPRANPESLMRKFWKTAAKHGWKQFQREDTMQQRRPTLRNSAKKGTLKTVSGKSHSGPYFSVEHYAGKVIYDTQYFLEKNRDTLSELVITHAKQSEFKFLAKLFLEKMSRTGSLRRHPGQSRRSAQARDHAKLSVSAKFKYSLQDLMKKMLKSTPHFVRCIKPNDERRAGLYVDDRVKTQLRYTGVLETSRIRRDGFSIRLPHAEFLNKYQTLAFTGDKLCDWSDVEDSAALRVACKRVIKRCGLTGAEIGLTLVFLKYYHGPKLLKIMEKQNEMATVLTKNVRRFLAMRLLLRMKAEQARREAEERERKEREEMERQLKEKIQREREAAEQARREAEEAERKALARAETQKKKDLDDARRRAEAAERAAQEAEAEAIRQRELQEKKFEEERQRQAAIEAEEKAREEQERLERKQRLREEYEKAQQAKGKYDTIKSLSSIVGTLTPKARKIFSTMVDEQNVEFDEDQSIYNGMDLEDDELTPEERELLKLAAQQRRHEEIQRRRELQKENAQRKKIEDENKMRELQDIQLREEELERQRATELEKEIEEVASRVDGISFGAFSFGSVKKKPAPSSSLGEAATLSHSHDAPSPSSPSKKEKKKKHGKGDSVSSKHGTGGKSHKLFKMFTRSHKTPGQQDDGDESGNAQIAAPSSEAVADTPLQSQMESQSRSSPLVASKTPPALAPKPLRTDSPQSNRGSGLSNTSNGSHDPPPVMAKRHAPPPVKPRAATMMASSEAAQARSTITAELKQGQQGVAQPAQRVPPPKPPRRQTAASDGKEVRRRKLVRGGNKKEAAVLPEWEEAHSALASLDEYLTPWQSTVRIKTRGKQTAHVADALAGPVTAPSSVQIDDSDASKARAPPPAPPPARKQVVDGDAAEEEGAVSVDESSSSTLQFVSGTTSSTTETPESASSAHNSNQATPVKTSGKEEGDGKPKEVRRRKLVRGKGMVEQKVLPEYEEALSALADLETALNPWQNTVRIKLGRSAPNFSNDNTSSTDDAGEGGKTSPKGDKDMRPVARAFLKAGPVVGGPNEPRTSNLFNPKTHKHTGSIAMSSFDGESSTAPSVPDTISEEGEEKPKEVRRRKLVRGGNMKKTPVLPEYADAMSALDDLNGFLDDADTITDEDDNDASASSSSGDEDVDGAVLGVVQNRRPSLRKRATEEEISALENVLLLKGSVGSGLGAIDEDGTDDRAAPADGGKATPQQITALQRKEWQKSLKRVQGRTRTNSVLDLNGDEIKIEDLASLPEAKREAILNLVKRGEMTAREALSNVVETKNRSNCLIM